MSTSYDIENCLNKNDMFLYVVVPIWSPKRPFGDLPVTILGLNLASNQEVKINPERGKLILFPPFWTHEHRGVTLKEGTKYIATTWIVFK